MHVKVILRSQETVDTYHMYCQSLGPFDLSIQVNHMCGTLYHGCGTGGACWHGCGCGTGVARVWHGCGTGVARVCLSVCQLLKTYRTEIRRNLLNIIL